MWTLLSPIAAAHDGAWPRHTADLRDWDTVGDSLVSPILAEPGSRVALVLTVPDDGPPLALSARGLGADGVPGGWIAVEETFVNADHRVLVADLRPDGAPDAFDAVQLSLAAADEPRVDTLAWDALVPRFPLAGRRSREADAPPFAASAAGPLPTELLTIGVIPRSVWGARATGCSALEDDWYRMAIHHTAGDQTSGGTVEGALRTTQAYMMDSGGYCDLAYQFMLGYDGRVFEGRPYGFYSGATGGNNDGNAAACYLGCYHPAPACPTPNVATDEMIGAGQLLVQTFSRLHGFPTTEDEVRGHRDWPDNATACPGDSVIDRIDEIRTDLAWFTAAEVSRSATDLVLAPGEVADVEITLRNEGGLPWEPGAVLLGTTGPRDQAAALADGSWVAPNRAATVPSATPPGGEAAFSFTVTAPAAEGTYTVSLGLVAEGITWFADAPWGGGPADDLVVLTVEVADDPLPTPTTGDTAEDPTGDGPDPAGFVPPPRTSLAPSGCGCDSPASGGGAALLAALLLARRRR